MTRLFKMLHTYINKGIKETNLSFGWYSECETPS